MAKTITLEYEDKEYTLEFSRESITAMERSGFDLAKVNSKPLSVVKELFAGAFKKNHATVSSRKIDEIYKCIGDLDVLLDRLVDMYNEALVSLDDEDSKKVQWTPSW